MTAALNVIYGLRLLDDPIVRYVGLTSAGSEYRFSRHVYDVKRGSSSPVHNWMRKHGPERVVCEVLEECSTSQDLPAAETWWIATLDTYAPESSVGGLNLTRGGDGTFGYRHTDESRQKMSDNHDRRSGVDHPLHGRPSPLRGTKKSDEYRRAASERVSGDKHPMFGKHHTDESKKKISESNMSRIYDRDKHPGLSTKDKICPSCEGGPYTGKGLGQHFRYNPSHRVDDA